MTQSEDCDCKSPHVMMSNLFQITDYAVGMEMHVAKMNQF